MKSAKLNNLSLYCEVTIDRLKKVEHNLDGLNVRFKAFRERGVITLLFILSLNCNFDFLLTYKTNILV